RGWNHRLFAGRGQFGGGCVEPSGRAAHRHAADAGKVVEPGASGRSGMIPQNFAYSSPSNLNEALALLAGGNAKVLAGGMSLIPLMKLRLAAPEHLVDLSRVPDLKTIREDSGAIRIGAMATHYEIESAALLRGKCPLLAEAASNIGDVQVRNMGTIGGSIAHADPAADYPASLVALEAQVRISSAKRDRTLSIADFLVEALSTALEPDEIVREIIV